MMGGFKNERERETTKLSCRYVDAVLSTFLEHVIINILLVSNLMTFSTGMIYHSLSTQC